MLSEHGFERVERVMDPSRSETAVKGLFRSREAGRRCLLDEPAAREIAMAVRASLAGLGRLPRAAVAIQAIAFDKTPDANWKVTWHQDVMFPFARPVRSAGFTLATEKDGVDYARPPASVLESLLAVRIHFDDCGAGNGPLRVSPGTHRRGVIPSTNIAAVVAERGETPCLAKAGDALLMKPLLLHASSPASNPTHRRVLHLVYHTGEKLPEPWYRAV
jgi:ectoine hydroxylase-related dioxygenase (phytanoyl-CoA dioxygenase family)